jgi:CIC family chloride channel protein
LVFLKILATSVTLGSGGSGGIFAPSLFMGAMLGYFFGSFIHQYFPEISASPGAYALVAMGGLVAGTTRAPITAIIIVFELTNDYHIILPLMVTCIISTILSSKLSSESIYTLKLLLRNIGIKEGIETNVMDSILVKDIYNSKFESLNASDNFSQVVKKVIRGKDSDYPVLAGNKKLVGVISLNDIKDYLFDRDSLQDILIAGDIANTDFGSVTPEDNCSIAMEKFRHSNYEGLPVVSKNDKKNIIGFVWKKDILDAYHKSIERREITANLASKITMREETPRVHFIEGYSINEIAPPKSFIGKSIRGLNIRAKYGVDVLSVKTKEKQEEIIKAIPNPDYIIQKDDTLIIAGEIKNINVLRNLD